MYQFTMGYPYQLHPGKIWSAAPDPKDIYLLLHALLWMHAINHNAVITCVLTYFFKDIYLLSDDISLATVQETC